MNENFENINPWAEKLQEASVPDFSVSWQAMETLLDQKMPVKKSNGWIRWLLMILSILLLIGVCNCPDIRRTIHPSQKQVKAGRQTSSVIIKSASSTASDERETGTGNKSNRMEPGIADSIRTDHPKYKNISVEPGSVNYLKPHRPLSNKENHIVTKGKATSVYIIATHNLAEYPPGKKRTSGIAFRKSGKGIKQVKANTTISVASGKEEEDRRIKNDKPGVTKKEVEQNKNEPGLSDKQHEVMKDSAVTSITNSVSGDSTGYSKINSSDTLRNNNPSIDTGQNRKKDSGVTGKKKNKKIAWAAGLGLNQFLAVGSQQQSDYNSAARLGTLSNYIPVPVLRAYLNRKLYLNLEVQFNTPQYTKLLLAKQVTSVVIPVATLPAVTIQSSVFIKELYYLNIPLSIHYSLFRNFFIGTGVQFSHVANAIGLFENQQFSLINSVVVSQTHSNTASLKSNAVYNEIKPNEFRFLFDASYQWKNLAFGLSYNQSLSDFINIHFSANRITEAKNGSLQLYVRYIIWKNKKARELLTR